MASHISRRAALTALAGSLAALRIPAAKAADKLRVGKAVAENFGNIPLDVGMEFGIFEKHGLTIEALNFTGGAKVAQAVTAGAVDISLSGGPEMAFVAKGAPEIAVASISSSPAFIGICVGAQSSIRGIDDLKGKKISIASVGSVTQWFVDDLNRLKGWTAESDRATPVVIGGSTAATLAALKTGQADASMTATQVGFLLESQQAGRLLADCSQFVDTFEVFTTFASTALIKENPDAVRRFLEGWYESVAAMKAHKADTVRIASRVMNYPPAVTERSYDTFIAKFSTDGQWNPKALETLRASFADLKILEGPVDMTKLYTTAFLPRESAQHRN
ncbi:MAG TPA: ABC transporter substrate-binding protein [Stellaceae bacterium]|nr:ABC transporter substrate-binding protein [Stellaceae bacterium]